MAVLLEVTFQDVNQEVSKSSMWVESEEISADVIVALKAASNAKIIKATLSTPVDISALSSNEASFGNVSTAACHAIVAMRGIDVDSTGAPFARVHIGIPAPVGQLADWSGDGPHSADVDALIANILSKTGVQMTDKESIAYQR